MLIRHRSSEWYKARIGKFTASNFSDIMSRAADGSSYWSKSAMNCILKSALQLFYNDYHERPDNEATRWGMNYENQAISEFAQLLDFQTNESGFQLHPEHFDIGATPDTFIVENNINDSIIIAEIKCPFNQKYHFDYQRKILCWESLKKSKIEYFWQIQGTMWVTNARYCYFVSFDPRSKGPNRIHYAKIHRDELGIEKLRSRIIEAIVLRNQILEEFRSGNRILIRLDSLW